MRIRILGAAAAIAALAIGFTGAGATNADDAKWVAKCVKDNASQGQSVDVVTSYCTCMTDKMSESETQSVSTWEKTHKKEAEECSTKAGWK